MRRFYIDPRQIKGDTAELNGAEARHIRTVLRLQPGDEIELVDGSGVAYAALIKAIDGNRVQAVVQQQFATGSDSNLKLTVALGFLKEKKMDLLVRHLTELGMTRFLPLWTERSIARPPQKRLDSRMERWQSIAREAVKQSKRGLMPEIAWPIAYDEAIGLSQPSDINIFFWENARQALTEAINPKPRRHEVFVLIGPEGGFSHHEAQSAVDCGFTPISMGPRILRAETAAITACALLQYLFGDMDKKSP